MRLDQVTLHRDDLILTKQWLPAGMTNSGIYVEHSETLPAIFADVVLVPIELCDRVQPGDFIVFPRYAGEKAVFDEGVFFFLHIDDVECIIDFSDEQALEGTTNG